MCQSITPPRTPEMKLKDTFTVAPVMTVTGQFLSDILTTAIEGGSNYWIERADSIERVEDKQSPNYLSPTFIRKLKVSEGEPKEGMGDTFDVTLQVMADGVRRLLDGSVKARQDIIADVLASVVEGDALMDADAADVVLQAGLFGEVVFG